MCFVCASRSSAPSDSGFHASGLSWADYTRLQDSTGSTVASDGGAALESLTMSSRLSAPETIRETTDASPNAATRYEMEVGDTFVGNIAFGFDQDWVEIDLQPGVYTFAVQGNSLEDPTMQLLDRNGNEVFFLDDEVFASVLSPRLVWEIETGGTYYFNAGSFETGIGTYEMSVTEGGDLPEPASEGTIQELADYLTTGFWEDGGDSPHRFDTSSDNEITVNIRSLDSNGQRLARYAFETWEMVADIEFVETTLPNGAADIFFDDEDSGAYATHEQRNGFTTETFVNIERGFGGGTGWDDYIGSTYIHEIGHALGLGHQGDYNGFAVYGQDETFSNDSYQASVMSYFDQRDNPTIDADSAFPQSAMPADIVAIQDLYGAPTGGVTAGDTTWSEDGTGFGTYMQLLLETQLDGRSDRAFTIYDEGGNDLLDLRPDDTDVDLDMNPNGVSTIGGLRGGLMFGANTLIEEVRLGSGNDTVLGNSAANTIRGGRWQRRARWRCRCGLALRAGWRRHARRAQRVRPSFGRRWG